MLMFFSQINQQIDQWRQRRAWLWLSPQNWFCHLLTSRALNFLWKEHFRVTCETFEYLWDFVRLNLEKQHMRFRSPVSVKKKHILHCGDWQQVTAMEVVDCKFCIYRHWVYLQGATNIWIPHCRWASNSPLLLVWGTSPLGWFSVSLIIIIHEPKDGSHACLTRVFEWNKHILTVVLLVLIAFMFMPLY